MENASNAFIMKRLEVQEEDKLPEELISSLMQCLSYPEGWVLSKCHGNYNYIRKNLQHAKTQNFQRPGGPLNNIGQGLFVWTHGQLGQGPSSASRNCFCFLCVFKLLNFIGVGIVGSFASNRKCVEIISKENFREVSKLVNLRLEKTTENRTQNENSGRSRADYPFYVSVNY